MLREDVPTLRSTCLMRQLKRPSVLRVLYLPHENKTTIFTAPEKVDEEKVRQTIKDAGYEVTGITQD